MPTEINDWQDVPHDQISDWVDVGKPSFASNAGKVARTAVDIGGKILGYPGGIVRTAVGTPIEAAANVYDGKPALSPAITEIGQALLGKAPRTQHYLEALNAPESVRKTKLSDLLPWAFTEDPGFATLQAKKGGMLDLGAGDVGDIVSDMAGAKVASKVTQALGDKLYRVPFRAEDKASELLGQEYKPSDLMKEARVRGGFDSIAEGKNNILDELSARRQAIEDMANKSGVEADGSRALQELRAKIDEFKGSRNAAKIRAADTMEKEANVLESNISENAADYGPSRPGANISQVLDNKSTIYNQLPEDAYNTAHTTEAHDLQKTAARGLKNESEAMAGQVGQADQLKDINSRMGTLLEPEDAWQRAAVRQAKKLPVSQVDTTLLELSPKGFLAKQGGKLLMNPAIQTRLGLLLEDAGGLGQRVTPSMAPLLDLLRGQK